eukprot:1268491-Rhodomonas_salina.1
MIKEVSKEEQEANMRLFNTFRFVATDLFVQKRLKALVRPQKLSVRRAPPVPAEPARTRSGLRFR